MFVGPGTGSNELYNDNSRWLWLDRSRVSFSGLECDKARRGGGGGFE